MRTLFVEEPNGLDALIFNQIFYPQVVLTFGNLFYIIEKIRGIVMQESKWEITAIPAATVVSLPSALGMTMVLSPRGIAREQSAQI